MLSTNCAIRMNSGGDSRRTWRNSSAFSATSYPLDEDFLAALADMPDASGAALGFDRLIMLATGAERVESVQWTPVFDPTEGSE